MRTFYEFLSDLDLLSRLWLIETYFTFDPAQYNQLFDDELGKLSVSSPEHRDALERMRGFNWVGYIAKSLRNAGYRDQTGSAGADARHRGQDCSPGACSQIMTSGGTVLWTCGSSGPWRTRSRTWSRSRRNRRRLLPTVPIGQERGDDLPDRASAENDEKVIDDFRRLVRNRLGELGIAVLDARLAGQETKSLVGREDLGSPGRFVMKRIVGEVKDLAREYAQRRGDPAFLREIERAMEREEATIQKRLSTTAARQPG